MNLHYTMALCSILLLFNACKGGKTTTSSTNDETMQCEALPATALLYKHSLSPSFKITNPTGIPQMLLTSQSGASSLSVAETQTFDKEGLYTLFQTEYYWADQTPNNINYTNYTTPQNLIDALKYSLDRWSFAITKKDYANLLNQVASGLGFSCQNISTGCLVTYVRIDSPADKVDLRRGDIITKINQQQATKELIYQTAKKLNTVNSFTVTRQLSHEICSCKITPREYNYKVVKNKIVHTNKNQQVAYFRLDSFLGGESITKQINTAFNQFKESNISKLIIDLRYNGGGSVDTASLLLDKLTTTHINEKQFTLAWNDDYQYKNETHRFKKISNALNLKQLIFLTTKNSASASELVISAMKPYMNDHNLVLIGDTTHGKPVGMSGRIDKNYYYFLINFAIKNALGFYDYFDGLPVTTGCAINDDPFHEMGDENESMLKAALHYIDEGSCQ